MLHNLFQNGLVDVQRQLSTDALAQQLPPWASAIKQYLEGHFAESITLAQLAEQAHLSVPHFCREFKKMFGMTVVEYLTQIRMQRGEISAAR